MNEESHVESGTVIDTWLVIFVSVKWKHQVERKPAPTYSWSFEGLSNTNDCILFSKGKEHENSFYETNG